MVVLPAIVDEEDIENEWKIIDFEKKTHVLKTRYGTYVTIEYSMGIEGRFIETGVKIIKPREYTVGVYTRNPKGLVKSLLLHAIRGERLVLRKYTGPFKSASIGHGLQISYHYAKDPLKGVLKCGEHSTVYRLSEDEVLHHGKKELYKIQTIHGTFYSTKPILLDKLGAIPRKGGFRVDFTAPYNFMTHTARKFPARARLEATLIVGTSKLANEVRFKTDVSTDGEYIEVKKWPFRTGIYEFTVRVEDFEKAITSDTPPAGARPLIRVPKITAELAAVERYEKYDRSGAIYYIDTLASDKRIVLDLNKHEVVIRNVDRRRSFKEGDPKIREWFPEAFGEEAEEGKKWNPSVQTSILAFV